MKVSLNWLSQYCDVSKILAAKGSKLAAHEYSIHVAEIDAVEEFGVPEPVVVGRVESVAAHPDSDHLNIVQVDVGSHGKRQIVCGAANVATAKFVPVALEGAQLAPDFVIAKRKVRGAESAGMICSEDELGLASDRAEGILKLEDIFDEKILAGKIGTSFWQLEFTLPSAGKKTFSYRLRDTVFEIDNKFITNRPDLFSVAGNAREASALWQLPLLERIAPRPEAKTKVSVSVETEKCLAYEALELALPSCESPWILKVLARRSGQSTKSFAVDITNLIATELGQPMHVFDKNKVTGVLRVRTAKSGEKLAALDGKTYELSTDDVVIADDQKVLAIAGVIGGVESAVSTETTTVIFEAATFDAVSVRKTAARIGCRTESSMRFEKAQDPLLPGKAISRVLEYVTYAGFSAKPTAVFSYLNRASIASVKIEFPFSFVEEKLGCVVDKKEAARVLTDLGFRVAIGKTIKVEVPSWRATKDISRPEDVVEEIGRILGYDRIAPVAVPGSSEPIFIAREISAPRTMAAFFAGKGFYDVIGYSFTSRAVHSALGFDDARTVHVANPYSVETAEMRRSLFCSLAPRLAENLKRVPSAAFFESGKIFGKSGEKFTERLTAAGLAYGVTLEKIQETLATFARTFWPGEIAFRQISSPAHAFILHPRKSGVISSNGRDIAVFGALHPQAAQEFGFGNTAVWGFEILELPEGPAHTHEYEPLAKFPGIEREFAFVLPETTPVAQVVMAVCSADGLVVSTEVGEVFRDAIKVGEGKKSVLVRALLRHPEKTLTDAEASVAQDKIIAAATKAGFLLRTA